MVAEIEDKLKMEGIERDENDRAIQKRVDEDVSI